MSGCSVSPEVRVSVTVTVGQEAPHGRGVSGARVERVLLGQEDCCFFQAAPERGDWLSQIKEKAGLVPS